MLDAIVRIGFAAFIPLARQEDSGTESISSDWVPGLLLVVCVVLGSAWWHLRHRQGRVGPR